MILVMVVVVVEWCDSNGVMVWCDSDGVIVVV